MESNTVYVGRKPVMTYVLSIVSRFGGGSNDVVLKARGRAITSAVDAAEITRRRFLSDLKIDGVTIGTEDVKLEEGGNRSVSFIEIVLKRGAQPAPTQAESTAKPA